MIMIKLQSSGSLFLSNHGGPSLLACEQRRIMTLGSVLTVKNNEIIIKVSMFAMVRPGQRRERESTLDYTVHGKA